MDDFSALSRLKILKEAQNQVFDLIIIGGGITGAGIALDAASRGLSVLLIEKVDFAFGTSSRSTKLIHGGLRYLKQLEFNLVREVGKERTILYQNAKHLVRPEPMLLPVIEGGSLGKKTTSIALWVYEWLAGVKASERRKMLSKDQCLKKEPLLKSDLVKGGAIYTEYRTDDARLTITVCKTAIQYGAKLINHVEVKEILKKDGIVNGVKAYDSIGKQEYSFFSHCIVNAAGPWVDTIRKRDGSLSGKSLHLTKGVHLVFSSERLPIKQAAYFDSSDGRMIFAIPRGEITYIGTTDTNYTGDISNPEVSKEDIIYLLEACNRIFPSCKLSQKDIQSSWAGLRPLIHEVGKNPSELSRKDEIFISNTGLISIAGGKLTGYRVMAQKVTNTVVALMNKEGNQHFKNCFTRTIQLNGGEFNSEEEIVEYHHKIFGEGKQVGINFKHVSNWVSRYGREAEIILEIAYTLWPKADNKSLIPDLAEMYYSIYNEMCIHPSDYFIRRTGQLYFHLIDLKQNFEELYPWFVKFAGLSHEQSIQFKTEFLLELERVIHFE